MLKRTVAEIRYTDNLRYRPSKNFDLIYIDPPFNTGKMQSRGAISYSDAQDQLSYFANLKDRMLLAHDLLEDNGSFFVHLDYRSVHKAKLILDDYIFGQDCFMNEIIWAYDYGGRSKKWWSKKHDSILWYVKNPKDYIFNYDEIDRVPYMAPGLVGEEKAKRGKTPTDVWWNTIVPTNGKEKTGYPTQKPLAILDRIVKVHSNEGDWLLDFYAGSGTTGEAALRNRRNVVLIDDNLDAVRVMEQRLIKVKKQEKFISLKFFPARSKWETHVP